MRLHNFPGQRWVPLSLESAKNTWSGPCCYAIQLHGVTVYVGSTLDLRGRLYKHRKGVLLRVGTEGVTMKIHRGHRYGDWAMREVRLIRRLRPAFNKRIG